MGKPKTLKQLERSVNALTSKIEQQEAKVDHVKKVLDGCREKLTGLREQQRSDKAELASARKAAKANGNSPAKRAPKATETVPVGADREDEDE
jgi:septal ring factor EnvC (AmiA/AmiB activator)